MATIRDIANKLGIAVSTVSKGLNGASDISDEMKQLVLDAAVELGYAKKKVRSSGHRKVCIFIENMEYQQSADFGYDIVTGFKMSAARKHWDVDIILANPKFQAEEKYDTYMLKQGYSGGFLLGFSLHDEWIRQLDITNVPTVLLDNYISDNQYVGYVGTDSFEGIKMAVEHLFELGHKEIAFLNGSRNSMVSEQRHQAFIQSMENLGLVPNANLVEYGHYIPDCAKFYVPNFLEHNATAIVCASDLIASGVISEVIKAGLNVPNNISVIGFDDLPIAANTTPPLTTIRQDRTDLGKSALLLLDGLVHGVSISKLLLRAKFIERASTSTKAD